MGDTQYDVVEVTVESRPLAGVRATVALGQVGRVFATYLDQVYAAARTGAVALDGQNVFLYRDCGDGFLLVDFCVGVTAPFTTIGAVTPVSIPAGVAAKATHVGSYAGLPHAHAAVQGWCRANGRRRTGVSWAVYGHWHDDAAQLRTDVYYLLEPAAPPA